MRVSSLRRCCALVAVMVLGGCTLLSGASDLTTDPALGAGPGTSSGGAITDAALDTRSRTDAISPPQPDGGVDASRTRLREITFEDGILTGLRGVDSVSGAPTLAKSPLVGKFSMAVQGGSSYGVVDVPPGNDQLYASLCLSITSVPMGAPTVTIARFAFKKDGTPTVDVTFGSGELHLVIGGTSISLGTAQLDHVYRVGVHVGVGGSAAGIDAQLVEGATTPFGPGLARIGSNYGPVKQITIGALDMMDVGAVFDQLVLDSAAWPAP